jgi:hypothetical protein
MEQIEPDRFSSGFSRCGCWLFIYWNDCSEPDRFPGSVLVGVIDGILEKIAFWALKLRFRTRKEWNPASFKWE